MANKLITLDRLSEFKDMNDATYASKANGIYYIVGNTTGTAGTWTGTCDDITEYYDGLTIAYKVGIAGASTTTLNINGLGAKTLYLRGTTKLTTHYAANTVFIAVYTTVSGTGRWYVNDYDANTTYSSKAAASGGTTVSLVTTGEKYTWNNKADNTAATTSAAGLMSAADKTKLDGIATGANAYTHPSYTARTGKPTANQTPAFGGTATVSQITSDATGHVTGATDRTITIPSTLSNGTGTAGLIKTSSTVTSNSGYTACPVISGVPYYKDTNTTYSAATTSAAGLMSAADKTKLNGIATGAEVNVQSDWSVTDTSSDAYIKNKPTIPTVGNGTIVVKQNGTGKGSFTTNQSSNTTIELTDTTYSAATTSADGLMSAADKSKVDLLDLDTSDGTIFTVGSSSVTGGYIELNNNDCSVNIAGDNAYISASDTIYITNNGEGGIHLNSDGGVYVNGNELPSSFPKKISSTTTTININSSTVGAYFNLFGGIEEANELNVGGNTISLDSSTTYFVTAEGTLRYISGSNRVWYVMITLQEYGNTPTYANYVITSSSGFNISDTGQNGVGHRRYSGILYE